MQKKKKLSLKKITIETIEGGAYVAGGTMTFSCGPDWCPTMAPCPSKGCMWPCMGGY